MMTIVLNDLNININNITTSPVISSRSSFAFENVYATLQPFYYPNTEIIENDALSPIKETNGLIFPFLPSISEGIGVSYGNTNITQANESFATYTGTQNVKLTLSNCTWISDTFDNARYTLSVLHFFRTFSLMDFGRKSTGRPPSPMWFSAYGNYAFHRLPVLLTGASWNFPTDVDYVGVPEPNSNDWFNKKLNTGSDRGDTSYTWIPIKFNVSLSLTVQHPPKYWSDFSLEDYASGVMLERNGSFHNY